MEQWMPVGLLGLAVGLAGCALHRSEVAIVKPVDSTPVRMASHEVAEIHDELAPSSEDIPSIEVLDELWGDRPPANFEAFCPHEVQCQAADASPMARLLMEERQALGRLFQAAPRKLQRQKQAGTALEQKVAAIAAYDARNESAAEALDLYFSLAQAEATQELLEHGTRQIGEALDRGRRLVEQGFMAGAALGTLEREQNQLEGQRASVENSVRQLNVGLKSLLGLDETSRWRIRPHASLAIPAEQPDTEQALATALGHNPRLVLLRTVRKSLRSETMDSARSLLSRVDPMLGGGELAELGGPWSWLMERIGHGKQDPPADLAARRRQLDALIEQQERLVRLNVMESLERMEYAARRAALAREEILNLEDQLDALKRGRSIGQADDSEILETRLSAVRARASMTEYAARWHQAHVELRRTQGVLALECGYQLVGPGVWMHYPEGASCPVCH